MSNPFQNTTAVVAPNATQVSGKSESELNAEYAQIDARKAQAKLDDAKAEDQIALTKLKSQYAGAVMFFLWFWFGALCLATLTYFSSQLALNKEIPKEVILGMFTATAVVVGLVGYILKGLFGNGN
ncbi:hypothetical protein ACEUAB_08550 [Aeromonas veronii]